LAARYEELCARLAPPAGGAASADDPGARRAAPARRAWRLDGMAARAPGYDGHRWAVAEAVRRIAAGDLFQASVCLRLDGRFTGDPLEAFADASATLQPAHGAYVTDGEHHLLSFSPELFLRRVGDRAWTAPIKGTAPRGGEAERAALAASAKDAAEHVMIVDLMRNDLGRVARYGSVRAEAPQIEPHPGLWHLVSRVEADLRPGTTDVDLVRAAFPPGSVTGAPKIQALHVIADLESTQREAYTGAIGFASPVAGLELNVAIRTLEVSGGQAWLGAGGGVVADSDPDAELEEALSKARPVLAALGATVPGVRRGEGLTLPPFVPERALLEHFGPRPDPALGVLETMLIVDGFVPELDAHLARLGDDRPRAQVLAAAAAASPGRHRLRLTLRAEEFEIEVLPVAPGPPAPATLHPVLLPGGLGDRKWADRRGVSRWERPHTALIVDSDGAVLEAGAANVFLVERGRYVTPPADGRILPGVTRAAVIALTNATEQSFDLDRLRNADAVLLTSAIALVTPVGPAAARPAADLRHLVSAQFATAPRSPGRDSSPAPDR
ncbi:MAG: para-aminobenzoate synthetase / 4-amino-4-deoxychorismate lyase, partial [Solirubrobacteraceae bacterium]|nr:para-aminobenzoate synthetase / 4-amino-4-deoxychorismate lyase [Solirubrobacteraceae bacterium]